MEGSRAVKSVLVTDEVYSALEEYALSVGVPSWSAAIKDLLLTADEREYPWQE